MKKNLTSVLISLCLTLILEPNVVKSATTTNQKFAEKFEGKILLQVQQHGEAWYVKSGKRFYLKDGEAAYQMMRNFGQGITNANLAKLPIGVESRAKDVDGDGDGLPDKLEEALGAKVDNVDTNGDGMSDGDEILKNNTNPVSGGKIIYDKNLVNKLKGKILLQVESRGEAWYVNPADGKRYYMKDGMAAYDIMRFLSTGISDENLNKIANGDEVASSENANQNDTNRTAKVAQYEKLFRDEMQYGADYVNLEITKNILIVKERRDLVDIAKNFNIFSAMMNLAKNSSNKKTADIASAAEDDFLIKQKYYFPLLRKLYLNILNEDKEMNSNFEYPYRCSSQSSCDEFEHDTYCPSNAEEIKTFQDWLAFFKSDLRELRVYSLNFNFSSGQCDSVTKYSIINDIWDNESLKDYQLTPISYLGL